MRPEIINVKKEYNIGKDLIDEEYRLELKALIAAANFDEALEKIAMLVWAIFVKVDYEYKFLYSDFLDDCLLEIASSLSQAHEESNLQPIQRVPIIVVTELYEHGGHSRQVEDLIKVFPEALVIATGYFPSDIKSSSHISPATRKTSLPNFVIPPGPPAQKIDSLRNSLERFASMVFLLQNPHDVVAVSSIPERLKEKTIFLHHMDHRISVGCTNQDWVHVDHWEGIFRACRAQARRKDNVLLHLSRPDRGASPITKRQTMVSCTSGSQHKYSLTDKFDYRLVTEALLLNGVKTHYHIGALDDVFLSSIYAHLDDIGLDRKRFCHINQVDSVWDTMLEVGANIYCASAPVGGGLTAVEAQGAGLAIIAHKHMENEARLIESENLKSVYNDTALFWDCMENLPHVVGETISLVTDMQRGSRDFYEANFSPLNFEKKIRDLVCEIQMHTN